LRFDDVRRETAVLIPLLALLLAASCAAAPDVDDFGLDWVVALEIDPEDLGVMRTGAQSKTPVGARLWLNHTPYRARIHYAGASSVDDLRRGFTVYPSPAWRGRTSVRLNAMSRDFSGLRALIGYRVMAQAGFVMPFVAPAAVWTNGDYHGLFLLQETYDAEFFAPRGSVPQSLYKARRTQADLAVDTDPRSAFSAKIGSPEMPELHRLIAALSDLQRPNATESDYDALEAVLDIDSVLRYMAAALWLDHADGINNNYFFVRMPGQTRLRILPWDLDYTLHRHRTPAQCGFFDRNALFSFLCRDSFRYQAQWRATCTQLYAQLDARDLQAHAQTLADKIADAHRADPFLSAYPTAFSAQVDDLLAHLAQQEALIQSWQKNTQQNDSK
jgi:hypothetical protein